MKTEFERIQPDEGSTFRLLHQKVSADIFKWHYHYHPEFEMVYVFNGHGRRHVGNHLDYYEDGDLVLIGSNLPHSGFGYDAIGLHEEIVIQFREDFLGELFLQKPEMQEILLLLERSKQGIQFYGETKQKIGNMLAQIATQPPFERLIGLLTIFQVLSKTNEYNFLNAADTRYDFSHKDEARLKKIYGFVEQNYQQPIAIKDVANVASLTVPSFCNYFKKVMNLTFTDFLNEYRINQACKLMLEEKSIVNICFEVGFNNVSYFSKIFKEIKGKTPSQFKKMLK